MMQPEPLPWWGNRDWTPHTKPLLKKLSLMELEDAISVMKSHFDEKWWEECFKSPRQNLLITCLIGVGTHPFSFIVSCGRDIIALAETDGLKRKIEQLKCAQDLGVLLEIE